MVFPVRSVAPVSGNLLNLAYSCSSTDVRHHPGSSGDHNRAIRCIEHLEGDGWQAAAGAARDAPTFLFAKCKVR